MTGHGRGVVERGGRRATVELRSVNHRYFDFKLRSGSLDPAIEERVVAAVRKHAERGAITATVRDESLSGAAAVRVDVALARGVAAALEELRTGLGLAGGVPLELIAAQPGVLTISEGGAADVGDAIAGAAEAAAGALAAMRQREGDTLARDLGARADRLAALAGEIAALAREAPEEQKKRLGERLARLLAGTGATVDEQRLAQEVALLADRTDVTEELVRLASHLEQVRALLAADGPVGRRLDFLVQELGREINTIGSKSQSAEIARRVVEAKAELEKVREQVQNVE